MSVWRRQVGLYLSSCTKLKCRWIRDINIKQDAWNLTEEKLVKSIEHVGIGETFQNRTPIEQAGRSTVNKWDLMKLKSFCKAKDTINGTKWQTSYRNLISKSI